MVDTWSKEQANVNVFNVHAKSFMLFAQMFSISFLQINDFFNSFKIIFNTPMVS